MSTDSPSTPQPTTTRLLNPTLYHLQAQQMRFKEQHPITVDPSQIGEGPSPFFFTQQESSPNLSDVDYMDLNTAASVMSSNRGADMNGPTASVSQSPPMLRHASDQGYLYGNAATHPATSHPNMKRFSAGPDQRQRNYYEDVVYYDQRYYRAFAGSAPANIGYNHMQPFPDHPSNRPFSVMSAAAAAAPIPPSSTGTPSVKSDMLESYEDDFATQANLQAVMEKRRRRRESHNAVERRRRDNINDRIHELGTLLPESASMEEGGPSRLNKGTILRKSVEQIKQLQSDARDYRERIRQLETTLQQLQNLST